MWLKNGIVRIFCELHAEMRLESRYLSGFQGGTVEMKEARLRALKQESTFRINSSIARRNERSPIKGIET